MIQLMDQKGGKGRTVFTTVKSPMETGINLVQSHPASPRCNREH